MPQSEAERLSEAKFLKHEAAAASGAIQETIERMRASVQDAGDVKAWAERYPWATVGAASAAGFLIAAAITPRRRRPEEEIEPSFLERVLADEEIAARIKQLAEEVEQGGSRRGAMLQSVGSTLWRTFGPAVQSALASALAAKAAAPDAEDVVEEVHAQDGDARDDEPAGQ